MTGPTQTDGTPVPAAAPVLRVVRGDPAPDELAALVAVVAAGAPGTDPGPAPRSESWAAYWRGLRPPLRPGPHGWRDSGSPQ